MALLKERGRQPQHVLDELAGQRDVERRLQVVDYPASYNSGNFANRDAQH